MTMGKRTIRALGVLATWVAMAGPVAAATPPTLPELASVSADDAFAQAPRVDDAVLAEQRGGFVLSGLQVNLGAQIRTLINGELAMVSTVTWAGNSVETSRVVSSALSAATAAQLQAGMLKTGSLTLNVGDSTVFLANDGGTAFIQNARSGLQNMVVNTASNIAIETQLNATIDLSGYAAFQASMQSNNLASSLGSQFGAAATSILAN